jgi:hypothetical protein
MYPRRLAPGVEVTNANHINQLEGPFVGAGGKAADGVGGYGETFMGLEPCNQVEGLLAGPAVGAGGQVYAGPTDTVQVSVNLPSVLNAVGHGISEVFNTINPL